MTTAILHAPPAWSAVFSEQLRVTFLRTRAIGVALAGAALLIGGMIIDSALDLRNLDRLGHSAEAARIAVFSGLPSSFPVVVAILLPFLMWSGEDTSRRGYHRMMPVAQSVHGLTRTLAGWVWMAFACALWVASTAAFNLVSSRITGHPAPDFQDVWWMWLVPITSSTVAYLYVSAAAVGSRWPAGWIALPVLGYMSLVAELRSLGFRNAVRHVLFLMDARYGFAAAIFGNVHETGADMHFAPSAAVWLGAFVIWGALAFALLIWAARYRAE